MGLSLSVISYNHLQPPKVGDIITAIISGLAKELLLNHGFYHDIWAGVPAVPGSIFPFNQSNERIHFAM